MKPSTADGVIVLSLFPFCWKSRNSIVVNILFFMQTDQPVGVGLSRRALRCIPLQLTIKFKWIENIIRTFAFFFLFKFLGSNKQGNSQMVSAFCSSQKIINIIITTFGLAISGVRWRGLCDFLGESLRMRQSPSSWSLGSRWWAPFDSPLLSYPKIASRCICLGSDCLCPWISRNEVTSTPRSLGRGCLVEAVTVILDCSERVR